VGVHAPCTQRTHCAQECEVPLPAATRAQQHIRTSANTYRPSLPRCHARVYDDRVGETTRFTHRADHEWYWLPQQQADELSMLKCYDSVTDGSVSRWSFHTACIDPNVPRDAAVRRNIVVRCYVFFDQ
jgi:hypothetical protein